MTSGPLLALFEEALTSEGLEVQRAEGVPGLRLGFTGEHGRWLCFARVDEERALATFLSIAPFVVAAERRDEVMRYLTRANLGLPLAAFELDLDEGEVRCRTALATVETQAGAALLQRVVWANVAAMDRYLPGLVACAQQGLSADKALALVEG